jgi:hypothetical protein
MEGNSMIRRLLMPAVVAAMAGSLFAGGFWLEFGSPKASPDAKAKDAVLLVRPLGCGHPEQAKVVAMAEGLVNGQRRSQPATVIPLSQPGTFAVKFDRPKEGVWVLSVVARDGDRLTGGLAPIGAEGFERSSAKLWPHKPSDADVQATLLALR